MITPLISLLAAVPPKYYSQHKILSIPPCLSTRSYLFPFSLSPFLPPPSNYHINRNRYPCLTSLRNEDIVTLQHTTSHPSIRSQSRGVLIQALYHLAGLTALIAFAADGPAGVTDVHTEAIRTAGLRVGVLAARQLLVRRPHRLARPALLDVDLAHSCSLCFPFLFLFPFPFVYFPFFRPSLPPFFGPLHGNFSPSSPFLSSPRCNCVVDVGFGSFCAAYRTMCSSCALLLYDVVRESGVGWSTVSPIATRMLGTRILCLQGRHSQRVDDVLLGFAKGLTTVQLARLGNCVRFNSERMRLRFVNLARGEKEKGGRERRERSPLDCVFPPLNK